MKLRFRSTFLGILVTFVAMTVLPVAAVSYYHARYTANDLSSQLLEQTSARVEQQVGALVAEAVDRTALDRRLLEAGRLHAGDFPALIAYWLEAMAVNDQLSSVFIGLEATGEATGVSRLQGKLSIWQSDKNVAGRLDLRNFWPEGYPKAPYAFDPTTPAPDIRTRPWYASARAARRPIWTETYPFLGVAGAEDASGVTYAAPVLAPDGTLAGVLSVDFDLRGLSSFLRTLRIGRSGFAFVVERRADGSERVIAHPDPASITGDQGILDGRVRALMAAGDGDTAFTALHFEEADRRYIGSYRALTAPGGPTWLIGIVVPESDILERVSRANRIAALVAAAALLLAVAFGIYVARQVARPLEQVSAEMAAIAELRIEPRPIAHSIVVEVDHVATAAEQMKTGLRSFQKYVPADLVRAVLTKEAGLSGERRRLTVYFSDIAGFTTFAERLSPEALVEQLREYLGALSAKIHEGGGTVDKFIGDAVMAFWGAPAPNPRHALDACAAALENQRALARLNPRWEAQGKPAMQTRIGLNTGDVIVGNIGSDTRLSYTVMGDAVNLASRLEGLNQAYGTKILLGETTWAEAQEGIVARPLDWVAVKGRSQVLQVYELLAMRGQTDAATDELAGRHAEALARYRAQEWDAAIAGFEQVLAARADDGPARLMIERCAAYRERPPGADWDGAHRSQSKK